MVMFIEMNNQMFLEEATSYVFFSITYIYRVANKYTTPLFLWYWTKNRLYQQKNVINSWNIQIRFSIRKEFKVGYFGFDTGLQTNDAKIACAPQVVDVDFVPYLLEDGLENNGRVVGDSWELALQIFPYDEIHRIQIRRRGRPKVVVPVASKIKERAIFVDFEPCDVV